MSAVTEDALAEKRPQMPEKYTWLRKATSLYDSCCVSLCVPTSDIDDARSSLAKGVPEDSVIDAVLKRVVAIKIPGEDSTWLDMRVEVRILQEIRRQVYPRSGGEHCIELLDHHDVETMNKEEPGWLVMASSSICCDLEALRVYDIGNGLPTAMLWLTITQLYEAVYFLHRGCKPPITHGDISSEAILVTFNDEKAKKGKSAKAKRPKISLISFSESEIYDPTNSPDGSERNAQAEKEDIDNLVSEMYKLVERCYEYGEWENSGRGKAITRLRKSVWKDETPEEVNRFVAKVRAEHVPDLEGLWAIIGKFAKEQLEKVSDEEWEEVRDSIVEVTETEGKLSDIVKDLLKGQPAKN